MARTRHQEGSVKENGDQWQGHFYVYDEAGGRHHKSRPLGPRTGAQKLSKWQAREKLREIVEQETGKPFAPKSAAQKNGPKDGTVARFWLERFAPFQAWNPKTRKTVESIFRIHVLPAIGTTALAELSKFQIQLLLQGLTHLSHSTVRKVRVYLWLMCEEAIDAEPPILRRNPVRKVKAIGGRPATKRYLTPLEIDLLMAELGFRDRLICRIACVLGLRPGELFGLKWDDLDVAQRRLRIDEAYTDHQWKPTKTDKSNGWVALTKDIIRDILAWKEQCGPKHPYMFFTRFGTPVDSDNFVEGVLRPAAIRAGIMPPRQKGLPKGTRWSDKNTAVNFQAMRRTCATLLQETAGDVKAVQSHLRHSNPNTSLAYYIEEVPAATRLAVEKLDARLSGHQPIPAQPLSVQ